MDSSLIKRKDPNTSLKSWYAANAKEILVATQRDIDSVTDRRNEPIIPTLDYTPDDIRIMQKVYKDSFYSAPVIEKPKSTITLGVVLSIFGIVASVGFFVVRGILLLGV